jgi:hypothetical protein
VGNLDETTGTEKVGESIGEIIKMSEKWTLGCNDLKQKIYGLARCTQNYWIDGIQLDCNVYTV